MNKQKLYGSQKGQIMYHIKFYLDFAYIQISNPATVISSALEYLDAKCL